LAGPKNKLQIVFAFFLSKGSGLLLVGPWNMSLRSLNLALCLTGILLKKISKNSLQFSN
jgi:hypothetical protein